MKEQHGSLTARHVQVSGQLSNVQESAIDPQQAQALQQECVRMSEAIKHMTLQVTFLSLSPSLSLSLCSPSTNTAHDVCSWASGPRSWRR